MKKVGIGIALLLVLAVGVVAGGLHALFGNNKPPEDGAQLGRATVVVDVPYVSMFLVDAGGGKFVLVDGGASPDGSKVHAALEAKGAQSSDVIAVVLTHGHSDHVAAAHAFPDVPLYAHEADVDLVEGRVAPKNDIGPLAGPNPSGLKVDKTFKGGDELVIGEAVFKVFHTPGHTAGNCALLVDEVLLLGDTAQVNKDDKLDAPPTIFSADPAQAIEAIRGLAAQIDKLEDKPTTLVGSHSGSTKDVAALTGY